MGTSTFMICFLLYLSLTSDTRTLAVFTIMLTGVLQSAIFCLLAEMLNTEAKNLQTELYNINWYDLDYANKQLVYMMIVGCTRKSAFKLGGLEINLESFTQVNMKVCSECIS